MTEIKKLKLESCNLVDDSLQALKQLLPEAFSESGIDFEKMRLLLGDAVEDDDQERYAFTWPGKADAIRASQVPSYATLRPCVEKSRGKGGEDGRFDSENIYIEGDNLEVLKLLQRAYHGKVKMIYIDPPYNTGHDFVYKDNFTSPIENYKQQAGLSCQANPETSGRFHSAWCSMMYPRLKLARELLRDDGVIFISIDDNEQRNLRNICDEIFGEVNFVAEFIWKSKLGKVGTTSSISSTHEYIVCFAKNKSRINFNKLQTFTEGRVENLRQWGVADRREDRPSMFYPIEIDNKTVYPIKEDGTEGRWRVGEEKAQELKNEGMLELKEKNGNYEIYRKFPDGYSLIPYESLLLDICTTANGAKLLASLQLKKIFDFSKPIELLERFLKIATTSNDIILDFFSGSATTAHAVMKLNAEDGGNRKYIMVQLPEVCDENSEAAKAGFGNICEIGQERIRRAGSKIKEELEAENVKAGANNTPEGQAQMQFEGGVAEDGQASKKQLPDIGFRVFKLEESGIVRPEPMQLLEDVIKPDRTPEDIVTEMMLKWGMELTLPIEKINVANYTAYSVAEGELICCMNVGLTKAALTEIGKLAPRRVLMLDKILDDNLKLNAIQIFKHASEASGIEIELRTV